MNIILVYENVDSLTPELTAALKSKGYEIVPFTQSDEIDQLGNHLGKVVNVFTDSKVAGKFLTENDLGNKFKILNILYVPKTPKITPEVQTKLDRLKLRLYYPAIDKKLMQDIAEFYEGKAEAAGEPELEFLFNVDESENEDEPTT